MYTVVTWPDSQNLMDREGFRENSYLVNDEQGLADFGSSAYFVNVEWLQKVEESEEHTYEKHQFCEQTYFNVKAIEEDHEMQEFDNPFNLSDDKIAIGFYLDEGNETIMVITCKSEKTAGKHLSEIDESEVEYVNFFAMPLEDRDDVARNIDDGEYTTAS